MVWSGYNKTASFGKNAEPKIIIDKFQNIAQFIEKQLVIFRKTSLDTPFATVFLVISDIIIIFAALFEGFADVTLLSLAPIVTSFNLISLSENQNMHPFRLARLADRDGDITKRWYVNFYVWDAQKNALVRKQDYRINQYKTATERRAAAKILINQINKYLKDGYYIDRNGRQDTAAGQKKITIISDAIDYSKGIFENTLRKVTFVPYMRSIGMFEKHISKNNMQLMPVRIFTKKDANHFIDSLILQGETKSMINLVKSHISAMFGILFNRDLVGVNPFQGVEKIKRTDKSGTVRHLAFNQEQIADMLSYMECTDKKLLYFVKTMFYTFMRPNEVRQIQVMEVLLAENKIFVPAHKSKNKKNGYVMIPPPLFSVMQKLVDGKKATDYIFAQKNGKPVTYTGYFYPRHREVLEHFGLFGTHTLYSWKHTGVVMAYKNGVKIKSIQAQCRHSTIAMTDTYLQSLGLYENEEIRLGMPVLPV